MLFLTNQSRGIPYEDFTSCYITLCTVSDCHRGQVKRAPLDGRRKLHTFCHLALARYEDDIFNSSENLLSLQDGGLEQGEFTTASICMIKYPAPGWPS